MTAVDAIEAAREAKARKLVDLLAGEGWTADQVARFGALDWDVSAAQADVNNPSVATRALVVAGLESRETEAALDPFRGLP